MAVIATPAHGVMEGKGAYNRYATVPAAGSTLALPLLEKAAQELDAGDGDEPLVIADYGASQGKNSLAPIRKAIETLRPRVGSHRPILVFHIDQPSNDFNTLFTLLDADADTYTLDDPNIYPCAIGKSFYLNVLPPNSVHLAWCSYAAVWLSAVPARIKDHFISLYGTGPERAAFQSQAAQDWKAFLSLRAAELRTGGRLVVVLPGLDDDGISGFEGLMGDANAVLAEMASEGAIRAEERDRMALGAYPRKRSELLAPFETDRCFEGLVLGECEFLPLSDSLWADYERHRNSEVLARKRALFFRSIFVPSLALGLSDSDDPERCSAFADSFESRLTRRLANHPVPLRSFVQVFVAAKRAGAKEP
jgi:hypothetical protein